MTASLIFLSHIHEEKELAISIKHAIEEEFSGFVDVFVSSDGTSVPAGANFLRRIEDRLIDCVAAIYLISPVSVRRNWVNFELGAVWVRNIMSLRTGSSEIPTISLCHSGIQPAALPLPLNNLNGILGGEAPQLESAFRSLQAAVGGRGTLKTDFFALARTIQAFEKKYTLVANINNLLNLLKADKTALIAKCEEWRLYYDGNTQWGAEWQ